MDTKSKFTKDEKRDNAVEMTFPASDAIAQGGATANEPPRRPVDRKPPTITREQIEQAERGDGHKQAENLLEGGEPVDQADRETVEVRQGTGPRETVSVLFVSLALAVLAGVIIVGYFMW